jgi:hypothetical protein
MSKLEPYRANPFAHFDKEEDPMADPLFLAMNGAPDDEDAPEQIKEQQAIVRKTRAKPDPIGLLKERGLLALYEKRFPEALELYLQYFDRSAGTDHAGVRVSFFLMNFRGLVHSYEPAGIAYDRLITERFNRMLDGRASSADACEWFSLMRYADFTAQSLVRFSRLLHAERGRFPGGIDDCLDGLAQAIRCAKSDSAD